ncbi:MAG: hypothetical protein FJ276_27470, partial [Planctomycetes bacterium]|nr:hypothetical protein [Planctomycetota bacterium]
MPDAVRDVVLESFLARQAEEGPGLAAASDLLTLWPLPELGGGPPTRYIAQYQCTGVLRLPDGSIGPV